ncbi:hypothetical protein CNMCM5793_009101 [Aspergillus hiratsukae]|uniref:F-box domain-containing protein n=1 Tax=Aspergillus hiratsukae TaxID=1194566 RepID=A0A8H6PZU7_9EURO|nr:hypothetical protein CNMCM5793_009101 [Aspergillus hiratsukae]KAF7163224.1 hypothetical protein CNMCM6106_000212 [Aspergillus hiratsukae]
MSLLNLPLDLLYEIASHLYDHDLNTLLRTCPPLYTVFNFELYRRDARRNRSRALFWSVQHNRNFTLSKSLEAGARAPWATLLWLAVDNDAVHVIKVLVEQDGVDINMVEQFNGIPLWKIPLLGKAVVKRSAKIVRFLLTREDLDPNIKDDEGKTPLAYAAWRCFNDMVKILLKSPHLDVNCTDNEGRTPLHIAAGRSNVFVVRTLLATPSIDVSVRDDLHHRTALLAAVESLRRELAWRPDKVKLKHRRTIQALLEHPATSVDYDTDPELLVMYRLSAQYGYEEIFRMLWSKGMGQLPRELDNSGILFFVAQHGQAEIMKVLLANGFDPEAHTEKDRTTLSVAAEHKQIEVIRLLLSTGKVDVNSKDQDGRTPLWWAMTHGWRKTGTDETVKLLIEHEATIPTIQGKKAVLKALYKALEYGNCFLSEMLFGQLDKLKPINGMNRRLLLSAVAKSEDISLAKTVLERAKIDLNARNSCGQTILDKAIFCYDLLLVDLLLRLDGIDLNSRDKNGDTALAIAMKELSNCFLGAEHKQFYETCVDKLLRHKDVTTASLDPHWLIDYIISYLGDGGNQKLIKLLILKDDRLVSDTVVEVDADTLLEWAQENQHRTIVRALKEKGRRMRTTAAAATTEAATTGAATTEAGRQTYTWTFTMERLQRGVETLVEAFLAPK